MSNTVDQKIVKMLFDNQQFEQGINQSIKSIDSLKQSLNFNNIGTGASIDSLASNLGGLGSSVDSIADKFSTMGIMSTTWIAKIANALGDLAGNAIQNLTKNAEAGYNRYNEMMESIQTIMYATRNQWDDTEAQMDYVTAQIDKLNWYTDETSYNLSDMTNSIGKFVSAGVSLDDAATAMEGISSWAAISGQNAEKASYAMYNLAQAMAIGKVTTADWKSIENANMATEEFKETAINTAVNLGLLQQYCTDEGEWFTYYAKQTSKGIEEIQVTTENMRTTLQYGWFDSEVLTETLRQYGEFADQLYYAVESTGVSTTEFLGYLDEYQEALANGADMNAFVKNLADREHIDNVKELGRYLELLSSDYYELGRASFKAAQESKTFKDSLDYTADAITTTWMNIFQDIFGNYLESKELWTQVSELMYEQMVAPLEEIEEQLALWNEKGGADVLKDSFWDLYDAISSVLRAVKEGFAEVFPDNLGINLLRFVRRLSYVTEEFKLRDDLFEFEKLKIAATNFAQFFENILSNFDKITESIKKAWKRIFPEKEVNRGAESIINDIRDFSYWLEELSEKFLLTGDDADKLTRTFAGLFAIIDIIRMLIIAIIEPFTNFDTELKDVNYGFLDATASLGDWLVSVRDFIRDNEVFKKAIEWLIDAFQKIPIYLDQISRQFFGMGLNELLTKIGNTAKTVFMAIIGLLVDFDNTVEKIDKALADSPLFFIWAIVRDKITNLRTIILDFYNFLSGKSEALSESTTGTLNGIWKNILDFFNSAKNGIPGIQEFFTSKWSGVTGFFDNIKDKVTEIWSTVSEFAQTRWAKIKGFFDGVKETVTIIWNKVVDFFVDTKEKVSKLWNDAGDGASNIVSKIGKFFSDLKSDPSGAWESIKSKAKETFSFIGNIFSNIGKNIAAKFEGTPIGDFFEKVGEKAKSFFENIPEKASNAWTSLKDFFGLVGTTAGDIWDSIPGFIENTWSNITGFVDNVKQKASDIWSKIQPYVAQIAQGFSAAGSKIKDNWDTIWPNIVGFFTFLGEKGAAAFDWISSIDWVKWWEDIKTWCDNTWTSIKDFFDNLPDKAKESFEQLTGTDWDTFLGNLAGLWDDIKTKAGEAWDAIKLFFENLPKEFDKFAQKFGYNTWAEAWEDWTTSIKDAYEALKIFFGLEQPDWMTEDGKIAYKPEEGNPIEGFDAKYEDGILTYKDVLEKINGLQPSLKEFFKVSPQFKASINILIGILTALGGMYLVWKALEAGKGLAEEISNFSILPKTPLDGFLDSVGDSVEALSGGAKKVMSGMGMAAMAAVFLEVAAALKIICSIDWPYLLIGVGIMGGAFIAIFATLWYMTKKENEIDPNALLKIGAAFDLMSAVFISIAGALWIIGQIEDIGMLIAGAIALGVLFGALVAVFLIFDKASINEDNVLKFASAMDILSGAMVAIAGSLWLMGQNDDIGVLVADAIALGVLFGALLAVLLVLDKTKVNPDNALKFASAVDILSGSMVTIAACLWFLRDVDPGQIAAAGIAIGLLMANMGAIVMLGSKFSGTSEAMLVFAGAVDLLSLSAVAAGLGMWLFAQAIATLASVGPEGVNRIVEGLQIFFTAIPTLITALLGSLDGMFEAFGETIVGFFRGIAAAITNNKETLTNGIIDFWMIFVDAFNTVMPEIISSIGSFLEEFFGMLTEKWPQIEAFLLMAWETILTLVDMLFTHICGTLDANMPTILSILEALSIGVMDIITKLIPLLLEQTELIFTGILDLTAKYTPQITAIAIGLLLDTLNQILENIEDITAIVTAIAIELGLGFIDGISQEIDDVIDCAIDFFLAFVNGFADAIRTRADEIDNAITNLKDAIVEAAEKILGTNNPNGGVFKGIGGNLINDFVSGITDGIGIVCSAVTSVIDSAINAAKGKDGLDERSPSHVFEGIGEYASEGLAEGLRNSTDSVVEASAEVAGEAVKTVTDGFADIGDKISAIIEDAQFPEITPVLDLSEVIGGAQEIGGIFQNLPTLDLTGSIGGGFNMPSGGSSSDMLTDALNKFTSKMTNGEFDRETINNTFNISGDDPTAIADEVSNVLQKQVDRRNAVWA